MEEVAREGGVDGVGGNSLTIPIEHAKFDIIVVLVKQIINPSWPI